MPVPEFAYVAIREADPARRFYENTFGANVFHVVRSDDGDVVHARLRIGDAVIYVPDPSPGNSGGFLAGSTWRNNRLDPSAAGNACRRRSSVRDCRRASGMVRRS